MQNYLEMFSASYDRVTSNTIGDRTFFDAFYTRFIASSPAVAEKFSDVDMVAQQAHLKRSLEHMLYFSIDRTASDQLRQVATRHSQSRRDVAPGLYHLWMEALIDTVGQFDASFDHEIEIAWRVILAPGIAYMQSLYGEPQS